MPPSKSVIISCAGIGSRLGLGTTKCLLKLEGKTLIAWQLEMFRDIEDIRVVVGYQAKDVIEEVLKYRNDVIFVFNHNYFETKTGTSFFLGAKDANELVIEIDGDLVIHPSDIKLILEQNDEFIGYSDTSSENAVFVLLNKEESVIGFSIECGDGEWVGPACVHKTKVQYNSGNVYSLLESYLPIKGLKIRAWDIDTYEDYIRVSSIFKRIVSSRDDSIE